MAGLPCFGRKIELSENRRPLAPRGAPSHPPVLQQGVPLTFGPQIHCALRSRGNALDQCSLIPHPQSRPDTHLPHWGRGAERRTVGGRCSQTKSGLSCRVGSRVACETQGDTGRRVSGGATRKPRDESGQARAAPPPPVGGGVEIAPSFRPCPPVPPSPPPRHPGFQFCSLESCPCFQGVLCKRGGGHRDGGDKRSGASEGNIAPRPQVCPAFCSRAGRRRQGSSLRSKRGAEWEFPLQETVSNVSPPPRWAWSWGSGEGALGTHCGHVLTLPHAGHRRRQPWACGGSQRPGPAP